MPSLVVDLFMYPKFNCVFLLINLTAFITSCSRLENHLKYSSFARYKHCSVGDGPVQLTARQIDTFYGQRCYSVRLIWRRGRGLYGSYKLVQMKCLNTIGSRVGLHVTRTTHVCYSALVSLPFNQFHPGQIANLNRIVP